MSGYRKLSRTASQRKALLRNQVTMLLYHGRIITTEAKAKEAAKIAEGLIALAVREKDDYENVTVTAKVPRKDKDGKRVKEVVDGHKVTVYDEVQKEIKKDKPARLHARRQMLKVRSRKFRRKQQAKREIPSRSTWLQSFLMRLHPSTQDATAVIPVSSRSGSAAATVRWKSYLNWSDRLI